MSSELAQELKSDSTFITLRRLRSLLLGDYYKMDELQEESVTLERQEKEDEFLNEVLATEIMKKAEDFFGDSKLDL